MILSSFGDMRDDYEVDSKSSEELKKQKHGTGSGGGGDGATIELVRKPRGRPPGSKNRPKPPVVITREADPTSAMRPHVLEIPGGHDVADALARYSRRRSLGICVLAGTGSVANVTLRQPSGHTAPEGATIGFRGRFDILSISATFLPPSLAALSPGSGGPSLAISLAGPQGQIVGGTVAGPLMAAGNVVVVAAAFSNPTFHRLPAEDDASVLASLSGGGGGEEMEPAGHLEHDHDLDPHPHHHEHHQQQHHHPHHFQEPPVPGAHGAAAAESSCGLSIYSCHVPSDVLWPPTVRPPPPSPY